MILLAAAIVTLATSASNQQTFDRFVQGLQAAKTMQQTPIETWLVPDWLQFLRKTTGCQAKVDPELEATLKFLNEPKAVFTPAHNWFPNMEPYSLRQEAYIKPIFDHLRAMVPKIRATYQQAQSLTDKNMRRTWMDGLKMYVNQLANNPQNLVNLIESVHYHPSYAIERQAHHLATMLGLTNGFKQTQKSIIPGVFPREPGIFDPTFDSNDSPHYQFGSAWYLGSYVQSMTDIIGGSYDSLHASLSMIQTSADVGDRETAPTFYPVLSLVPVGHRMTISLISTSKYPLLLDMIKAEDGHLYGVKYAVASVSHPPAVAFSLPSEDLPKLINFFVNDYGLLNDIHKPLGLSTSLKVVGVPVNLAWYKEAPKTPLAMLHQFISAWPNGNRLHLGAVWKLAKLLRNTNIYDDVAVEDQDCLGWVKMVSDLSNSDSELLLRWIRSLPENPNQFNPMGSHTRGNKAKAVLDMIMATMSMKLCFSNFQ